MPYPAPYPAPRRVVSGLDSTGKSTIVFDGPVPMAGFDPASEGPSAQFGQVWSLQGLPADLGDTHADKGLEPVVSTVVNKGGAVWKVVDMGPGVKAPMHFTDSFDFAVVLKGEIHMGTSDGKLTKIEQGSLICQQGAEHDWQNLSDAWARLIFCVIETKPLEFNGKPIEANKMD